MAVHTESDARRPLLAGALLRTQPDERLAELAGDGSERAFEELVRRHRANLVTFAGTIAPSGYADDVVQDSVLKARAALLRGDRPEHAKAWLYKIVRNTALNERRGHREHDRIDESVDGVEQPPQAFERRSEIKDLVVALNDLPEAQRDALVQRELEGRGHDEIATALQVSPGAVRQLIHRARTTLRAGAGAMVPAFLLRAALLGAGSEQAIGGAAAAGLGATGVKVGLSAILATGAIVGGVELGKGISHRDAAAAPVAVEPGGGAAAGTADAAVEPGAATGSAAEEAAKVKLTGDVKPRQRGNGPQPQQFGQRRQGAGGEQRGDQPPSRHGPGGGGQRQPPEGEGRQPTGGGHSGGGHSGGGHWGGGHSGGGQQAASPPPPQ